MQSQTTQQTLQEDIICDKTLVDSHMKTSTQQHLSSVPILYEETQQDSGMNVQSQDDAKVSCFTKEFDNFTTNDLSQQQHINNQVNDQDGSGVQAHTIKLENKELLEIQDEVVTNTQVDIQLVTDHTNQLQQKQDSQNSLISLVPSSSQSSSQQVSSSTTSSQDTQVEVAVQDNKVNLLIDKICKDMSNKKPIDENIQQEETKNEIEVDKQDVSSQQDEEEKQQILFDPNLIFDQPDNNEVPDPKVILEQLKLLLQNIPDFNSIFPAQSFGGFFVDPQNGFNNDQLNNSFTLSSKPRGNLWDSIQEHIKINNHEVADGFIKDIVKRPQLLSFKWFVQKLFSQNDPVKETLYEWLLNMNQNQAMYIEEIEKANQLLRESLWEMKKPETEPYLKLLTRESARIENKQYFKRRQAELSYMNDSQQSDIQYNKHDNNNERRANSVKKYTTSQSGHKINGTINDKHEESKVQQTFIQLENSIQVQKSSPSKVNQTQNFQVNQTSLTKIIPTDLEAQHSKVPSPTKSQQSQNDTDKFDDQTPSKKFFDNKLTTSCQIPSYENHNQFEYNHNERIQSFHREGHNTSRSATGRQSRWQEPRAQRNSNDMNRSLNSSQNFRNQRTFSPKVSRGDRTLSLITQEKQQYVNRGNQLYHYKEQIGNKSFMNTSQQQQYQPRMTKYQALQNYNLEYEDQNMYHNYRHHNGYNKRYTGFQHMTHPSNYQQMCHNQKPYFNNRFYQNDNQNSYYDQNQSQYHNQRNFYNLSNKGNGFQQQQFFNNNRQQFGYQNQYLPRNYYVDYNNNRFNNNNNFIYQNNNNNYQFNNYNNRNSHYQRFNNSYQY